MLLPAVLRKPGVDVWLAGIHYEKHSSEAWIGEDGLLPHLFRRLQEASIRVSVHLQPLAFDGDGSLGFMAFDAWRQTVGLSAGRLLA